MAPARVIALALLMGQVVFAGVILFLQQSGTFGGTLAGPLASTLSLIALGLGFAMVPVALTLHGAVNRRAEALPEERQPQARLTALIVALALLEGAALFNLVVWLLTGVPMPNVAMVGLLVAVQLYLFPR